MSIATSYSAGELKKPRVGVVAFAGSIGTIIEWYDFLIYGTASSRRDGLAVLLVTR